LFDCVILSFLQLIRCCLLSRLHLWMDLIDRKLMLEWIYSSVSPYIPQFVYKYMFESPLLGVQQMFTNEPTRQPFDALHMMTE